MSKRKLQTSGGCLNKRSKVVGDPRVSKSLLAFTRDVPEVSVLASMLKKYVQPHAVDFKDLADTAQDKYEQMGKTFHGVKEKCYLYSSVFNHGEVVGVWTWEDGYPRELLVNWSGKLAVVRHIKGGVWHKDNNRVSNWSRSQPERFSRQLTGCFLHTSSTLAPACNCKHAFHSAIFKL